MFIVSYRLDLRDYCEEDFVSVHAFRSDPDVVRYWTGKIDTPENTRAFLQRVQEQARQEPRNQYRLAVVCRESNQVIGGCGLFGDFAAPSREGGIGYYLNRQFWGSGYATEVAGALVRFGFEQLNLHRIYGECAPENPASARVMEKIGMRREGHLRQNYLTDEGWQDTFIYAILEDEWHAAEE